MKGALKIEKNVTKRKTTKKRNNPKKQKQNPQYMWGKENGGQIYTSISISSFSKFFPPLGLLKPKTSCL